MISYRSDDSKPWSTKLVLIFQLRKAQQVDTWWLINLPYRVRTAQQPRFRCPVPKCIHRAVESLVCEPTPEPEISAAFHHDSAAFPSRSARLNISVQVKNVISNYCTMICKVNVETQFVNLSVFWSSSTDRVIYYDINYVWQCKRWSKLWKKCGHHGKLIEN